MKKIEEIKNEISRDLGNENFKELFKNAVRNMPIEKAFLKINDIINEASLIYANKCVKDSLKKASEKYTKKINEFQFGKPKIYFFIDGSEKEYTDIQELCNDWNEISK